ncbi:MAG: twin-arginine translocase TatA/TatE family subunit [Verrucomicrobiota bacterium]|nr:twin-arginine translocase TatA/TatE family subunit [Verrucomicrobiota bacterium]|tara:strand:+ start:287 stop:571 length:285 start_codon:yes stop_codon:yes gene_type:complete
MTTHLQLAFGGLGPWEIILILAVVLVLFGAKKLPELAKGMGQGIKEFKKASKDVNNELERAMDDTPSYTPPPAAQLTEETSEKSQNEDDSKKSA